MKNRRTFFKNLLSVFLAPKVVEAFPPRPVYTMAIQSMPVYVGTRKLKTNWSVELEEMLFTNCSIDAQKDLDKFIVEEIVNSKKDLSNKMPM